ncbi:MAG: nucleotidyltransferase domain-containing protein [Spirosomataceae bacterium]
MKKTIPKKSKSIEPIISQYKKDLEQIYGGNMVGLILFGSYANGLASRESDVDLLLVLSEAASPTEEADKYLDTELKYLNEHELYLSTIAVSRETFENSTLPFYRNIRNEGINL